MQEKTLPNGKNASSAKPNLSGKKDAVEKIDDAQQRYLNGMLFDAVKAGWKEGVESRINKGADVNARGYYESTALMHAAWNGHTGVCHLLIEKGARLDAKDEDGKTAVMCAENSGHFGTAAFLRVSSIMGAAEGLAFLQDFKDCIGR
jgi:ankyrin repeat protein